MLLRDALEDNIDVLRALEAVKRALPVIGRRPAEDADLLEQSSKVHASEARPSLGAMRPFGRSASVQKAATVKPHSLIARACLTAVQADQKRIDGLRNVFSAALHVRMWKGGVPSGAMLAMPATSPTSLNGPQPSR